MEFSYPPLMPDEGHDSNLLPEEWKYLPFLALPDGAHNYQEGTSLPHTLASWSILKIYISRRVSPLQSNETRWNFACGAQRNKNRYLKNSTVVSLWRNHDTLTQHNTHTLLAGADWMDYFLCVLLRQGKCTCHKACGCDEVGCKY